MIVYVVRDITGWDWEGYDEGVTLGVFSDLKLAQDSVDASIELYIEQERQNHYNLTRRKIVGPKFTSWYANPLSREAHYNSTTKKYLIEEVELQTREEL